MKLIQSIQTLFILGFGFGIGAGAAFVISGEPAQAKRPQNVDQFNPSVSLAPLVEALSPAVVNIDVAVDIPQMDYGFPFGWPDGGSLQSGQGSGFIISEDGYVLTNYHVVDKADSLTVKLSDDRTFTGTVIGFDDSIDVALLKIEADIPLPYVELGKSNAVRVGDWAVAIGNPFGLSHTVTSGIISAKERVIGSGPYDNYLQTDASINPGNSGGPLFNLQGEVIGINTAINPRAQGIGFSLPIDKVSNILNDLKENGRPSRGWLGVGLDPNYDSDSKGAKVGAVYANTPAFEAGLEMDDIVISFDGQSIQDSDDFIRLVGSYRAGDVAKMVILRDGQQKTLSVTLGERPSEKDLAVGRFQQRDTTEIGVMVAETAGFNTGEYDQGVVVLQIVSQNALTKVLKIGDVIVQVDGQLTRTQRDFYEAVSDPKAVQSISVLRAGELKRIKL